MRARPGARLFERDVQSALSISANFEGPRTTRGYASIEFCDLGGTSLTPQIDLEFEITSPDRSSRVEEAAIGLAPDEATTFTKIKTLAKNRLLPDVDRQHAR